jgi:hypothetical protein
LARVGPVSARTTSQLDDDKTLDPAVVLPFEITPANFDYWSVAPGELFFKDSVVNFSVVEPDATALLLRPSNRYSEPRP